MKKLALTMVAVASLAVAGCQQTSFNKENMGMGIGALAGGLAGSQVGSGSGRLWATGAGVLLGGLLGSNIGASLDKADMAYAQQAAGRANTAPIGQAISWNNPQTGNYGSYTPVRDGRDNSGRYCREYQQTITVGGRKETAYGTACQSPNGDWEIIN
jgi:surface antigen